MLTVLPLFAGIFSFGASAAGAVYDGINQSDAGMTVAYESFRRAANQSYSNQAVSFKYGLEMYATRKRFAEVPHTFRAWVKVSSTDKGVVIGNYRVGNDTAGAYLNVEIAQSCIPCIKYNDDELLCHYNVSAESKGKDLTDATGNGYDMLYDKTWLTEDEMVAIRLPI